jgi:hypothetical protein
MRESGKAASIVSAAVALLSSAVVMPSLAAIFNEGWDDHYGQHQTYAWAYLSAWYNTRTRTWYGISHDHDWDGWGPYYYAYIFADSNDAYDPFTRTYVYYSTDDVIYYLDAYAYVQF